MATSVQVVFDCADPPVIARFWAEALGYQIQGPPEPFESWEDWLRDQGVPKERWNDASAVIDPEGRGPRIFFQRVPEAKAVKNRVHLDLNVGGGPSTPLIHRRTRVDNEAERLARAGASFVRAFSERGEYFVTMLDPEGNEFDIQ